MSKCQIETCDKAAKTCGKYCAAHYEERRRHGKFLTREEREANKKKSAKARTKFLRQLWKDPEISTRRREDMKAAGMARRKVCSVRDCVKRARAHGLCPVHYWHLRQYGSPTAGPVRPNRGKGLQVHYHGYHALHVPTHPDADSHGYVMEHRLVMEAHLGRRLSKKEIVHHRDGNVSNNVIENLEVMTQGEHMRLHRRNRLAIASKPK